MSNRVIGIDPGVSGALALVNIDLRDLIEVVDMPTIAVKRGKSTKNEIAPSVLSNICKRWKPACAVMEKVGAMPGQGVSSMFAFGRAAGVVEGVLAAHDIPIAYITPNEWKRKCGIPSGAPKDESRARVLQMLPQHSDHFTRKKDHGRADAVMIAAAYGGWFER